jgi:hypothetical protein
VGRAQQWGANSASDAAFPACMRFDPFPFSPCVRPASRRAGVPRKTATRRATGMPPRISVHQSASHGERRCACIAPLSSWNGITRLDCRLRQVTAGRDRDSAAEKIGRAYRKAGRSCRGAQGARACRGSPAPTRASHGVHIRSGKVSRGGKRTATPRDERRPAQLPGRKSRFQQLQRFGHPGK